MMKTTTMMMLVEIPVLCILDINGTKVRHVSTAGMGRLLVTL